MLNKLAWRNARRSVKNYFVYLFTMILITALMFAFHSMIFSDDIQQLSSDAGMFAMMIGMVTVFIVLLVIWLIHYMVRFMAERRSREFGLYLLMGFRKKQVARLFLKENTLLGFFAFLLGLIPGIFFQQVLTTLIYAVLQTEYHLKLVLKWEIFAMTAGIYAGAYFLALFRNHRRFRKLNIRGLLDQERENEKEVSGNSMSARWLFFLSVAYIVGFGVLMYRGKITMGSVWFLILGLLAAVYLMYIGLSAFLVAYIRKGGKSVWNHGNVFVLRQLASKIRTMRFTMGTLTVLFAVALVGISCALMLNRFQLTQSDEKWPFDVAVYRQEPDADFEQEEAAVRSCNTVVSSHVYRIWRNETTTWRDALLQVTSGVSDDSSYFRYDTYMLLSDYNFLRRMLGREEVSLGENEYLVQIKGRLRHVAETIAERPVNIGRKDYYCAGIETEGFEQNGQNGADYLLIVPDSAASEMTPYYSLYMAEIEGSAAPELQEKLYELQGINGGQGMLYDDWYEWEAADQDHGYGTDTMYVTNSSVLIKSDETYRMRFIFSVMMFPLFYIGLVFLCVALTVLAVQQLSDAGKYRKRYEILRRLGMREKDLHRVILRQIAIYYLCPFLAGMLLSGGICAYISDAFVSQTGVPDPVWYYFGSAVLMFGGIYLIYFCMTYLEFEKSLRSGKNA